MIAKSATTAATLKSFKSVASSNTDKIEKLQNVVKTGIFRPKTEFSRTSIFLEELVKSGRTAKFRTDILIEELVRKFLCRNNCL